MPNLEFEYGYEAFECGYTVEDNPYDALEYPVGYYGWRRGFLQAQDESGQVS